MGRLEDERAQPSGLTAGPHSFEPSIVWKVLDVFTPHVFGSATGGWTDNVLLSDPESPGPVLRDSFGRFEAGSRVDTNLTDHILELEYRFRVTEYVETGEFDTFEQNAKGRLDLLFTDVALHGDVSYERSEYPQSIQLRGIVRLDHYSFHTWGEVGLKKIGFRLGVYGDRLDYRDKSFRNLDYRSLGGDAQVFFEIVPKLYGLVEYNLVAVDYDEGRRGTLNDYVSHQVRGGVRGELTPKLTASIKLGATIQDVRRGPNPDSRDYVGFSGEASIRWQPLVATTLTLLGRRTLSPSVNSNFFLNDEVRFQIGQLFLDEQLELGAHVGYSHARAGPGNHLNRVATGASAAWQIRQWLSLAATYEFENLISSFPLSDYRVHVVTISVGVGF